ncbi:hypothetical protein [Streptomyces sp. LUP30]|uniref:hypothetical protein n=1 Tax=Streptomyces sp. LUP30 TaxID=1890285 RepID=UPI000851AE60|nr:hypothetical protein [Streptomyces sp. LUP30]
MRRPTASFATLGLATLALTALGVALPATAQASAACDANWNSHGRDGNVRAWRDINCQGELLGVTPGSDPDWWDTTGPFQGNDGDAASSVMNSGYVGGKDVVAFYFRLNYLDTGYGCLKPGELYVDDLTRSRFTNGHTMNDSIVSHTWVRESACAPGSFIS